MNPEAQLRDRLRQELGDPSATSTAPPAPAAGSGPPGSTPATDAGWAGVEAAGAQRDRRARWLVRAGELTAVAAVLILIVVALTHAHRSSTSLQTASPRLTTLVPRSSTTATARSETTATTTTVPVNTGPTVAPTVPPTSSTSPPGTPIDCGTAYLASGWPTTVLPSPTLQQCILSAFAAGTPATYRERAQTDGEGGHIEITTYEVIGVNQVRRTVDATGALPPGGVTVSICTGLAAGSDGQLSASGCRPA